MISCLNILNPDSQLTIMSQGETFLVETSKLKCKMSIFSGAHVSLWMSSCHHFHMWCKAVRNSKRCSKIIPSTATIQMFSPPRRTVNNGPGRGISRCFSLRNERFFTWREYSHETGSNTAWLLDANWRLQQDLIDCQFGTINLVFFSHWIPMFPIHSPNSEVNTWGSYGSSKRPSVRSRCRTEFVPIYVFSCLHVRFVCEFS